MTGFSTINTAVTGLAAAQRALDATSQNIVNANTPGYSRQRVLVESVGATARASFHTGNGAVIGGARVAEVTRIHDAFLEGVRQASGGKQAAIGAQLDTLTGAQQLLAEPSDSGLQSTLDSFYSAWHDVANNPSDTAAAAVVIQRGTAVAEQLKTVSDGIGSQWTTSHQALEQIVIQTNQAAADLAKLNTSIDIGRASGQVVNELMDTRDTLVRKLATLIGASSTTDSNGTVSVNVNGIGIVNGSNVQIVRLTGATDISSAVTDPPTLMMGTYTVPVESGQAAGLLAVMRTDLPGLQGKVDGVASALNTAVNGIYSTGYASDGTTGANFFSGTTAQTMTVVPTGGAQLQVAATANTVDGSVAGRIGDLAADAVAATALGGTPGPSVRWRQLTSVLGVQVQSLITAKSTQDSVVATDDGNVQSDSGVNLDEEMTNMMLFQRSYQASARAISTADTILDTLINRMGV